MNHEGPELTSLDPTQIFIPGPILSDEDEFGTLISAEVAEEYITLTEVSTVSIRILPVGQRVASALRKAITRVSEACASPSILRYIGVWEVSPKETWLVSERRAGVSIRNLLTTVESQDAESVIAFVVRKVLDVLRTLHETYHVAHSYIRPCNIYIDNDGLVSLGDIGIYQVIYDSLKARRAIPGAKIWPFPRPVRNLNALFHADFWDLGIAILLLVDGGASVSQQHRSGRLLPRLCNPAQRSAQLNDFLSVTFERSKEFDSLSGELLEHRFVSDVSSTACIAAVEKYHTSAEELITGHYVNDTISGLFRQNLAVVRAPLLNIDDISTEHFTYEQWGVYDQNRPTVEMSLLRVLRNCRSQPLPKDTEERKNRSRLVATLESFLETADLQ